MSSPLATPPPVKPPAASLPAARTPAAGDVAVPAAASSSSTTTPGPATAAATASTPQPQQQAPPSPPPPPPLPLLSHSPPSSPPAEASAADSGRRVVRNVSPGLLARMKFLDHSADANRSQASQIGRIAASKIRELDNFHRDRSIRVERRGTAWNGTGTSPGPGTPLIPQLTGGSVPALALAMALDHSPPPGFESDGSSFVSTSDRVLPSDSEQGDVLAEDTQKYRLPDITKTKSLSQSLAAAAAHAAAADSPAPPAAARPPTPPPKDAPPADAAVSVLDDHDGIDVASYFQHRHLSRANSIYTLSRASFTNQIQRLTSITLPSADFLSTSISSKPNSTAAGRALHDAANKIKLWMAQATEVLSGLDADDDVEWAAAAGREGLAEVDVAIGKFEGLVSVYITAIEELQERPDIASLPARDLTRLVAQMEDVMAGWTSIKRTLKGIKAQVEIAMEWEELWNTVLGEIGHEVESLGRLVFEMEERRHRAITDSVAESAEKFDIADLETIVEETPRQQARLHNNRFSLPPTLSVLSPISPIPQIEQENSRLLALFAKLQPLRASLDFLPMRLSSFQMRASSVFPSACDELMRRKEVLEQQEKKLEADADALREELGEDKWVHSFRQAGSKAIAMYDSLMKSIQRLRQVIDEGDDDKLGSRVSTYKDKREHYPPSMKRVLDLIDIEMKNRSTVNGEILRIQQDVRQKVAALKLEISETDIVVEELATARKLRDSVSTVLSARTEASMAGSALDTPASSPASSIVFGSRRGSDHGTITPAGNKSRQPSGSSSRPSLPASRRYSSLPSSAGSNSGPRKALTASRLETIPSTVTPSRAMSSTPTRSLTPGSDKPSSSKPRWNASVNMRDTVVGHNFKPLTLTTPSPYRKDQSSSARTLRSVCSQSAIPVRSPLSNDSTLSPPSSRQSASTTPAHQAITKRPLASPMLSPSTPTRNKTAIHGTPGSSAQVSTGTPASRRHVTIAEEESDSTANEDIVCFHNRNNAPFLGLASLAWSMPPHLVEAAADSVTSKRAAEAELAIPLAETEGLAVLMAVHRV
ncbi:hypothetical protein BDV95DRAFT_602551 [Massariosphaeria phaeospora]|uniref:KAR9-domain-containing protein n=1 Tax=Massariosphaeria phaeospora TaxID=100035 RepID=A0A7C8IHA6_9PLEO|nr:hypothetical protein BDV95DRAFT_602551 [Massariosphaeria phaeospora]